MFNVVHTMTPNSTVTLFTLLTVRHRPLQFEVMLITQHFSSLSSFILTYDFHCGSLHVRLAFKLLCEASVLTESMSSCLCARRPQTSR